MGRPWTPCTPEWVTPPVSQIADEHWLAYAGLHNRQLPRQALGILVAINWVRASPNGAAPITDRTEQPVTRALAEAESWAACAASDPFADLFPLGSVYVQLGVAPAESQPGRDGPYALGAWRALRWLLGVPDQGPPIPVPHRHPDGSLYTADDLYAAAIRAAARPLSPEQRARIRSQAGVDAIKHERYAEEIIQTQRELGWDAASLS